MFQPLIVIYRNGNFVYRHFDLQKFIGYCLIPLDPCLFLKVRVKKNLGAKNSKMQYILLTKQTNNIENGNGILFLKQG